MRTITYTHQFLEHVCKQIVRGDPACKSSKGTCFKLSSGSTSGRLERKSVTLTHKGYLTTSLFLTSEISEIESEECSCVFTSFSIFLEHVCAVSHMQAYFSITCAKYVFNYFSNTCAMYCLYLNISQTKSSGFWKS